MQLNQNYLFETLNEHNKEHALKLGITAPFNYLSVNAFFEKQGAFMFKKQREVGGLSGVSFKFGGDSPHAGQKHEQWDTEWAKSHRVLLEYLLYFSAKNV